VEHNELPTYRHGAKCSCGWFSMGVAEDPALFSDHLRTISLADEADALSLSEVRNRG